MGHLYSGGWDNGGTFSGHCPGILKNGICGGGSQGIALSIGIVSKILELIYKRFKKFSLHFSYFFDATKTPYYEIMYFYSAFGIPACANCIISIDMIFMGLCLHTVALFKDLKANISRVEREAQTDEEFKMQMSFLIDYHNRIFELMTQIEMVFSRIFFSEFFGTVFILCSQSYLAAMVSLILVCYTFILLIFLLF